MHIFGTAVDPRRPKCRCLVAKPGASTSDWLPKEITMIDLEDWPQWFVSGFILFAIDPIEEPALEIWIANHQEH
jgi:hypothetical protein